MTDNTTYPTTCPKYNEAHWHWQETSQVALPATLLGADTCADLLQHYSRQDLSALCELCFVKKIPRTKTGMINAIISNRGEHSFFVHVQPIL